MLSASTIADELRARGLASNMVKISRGAAAAAFINNSSPIAGFSIRAGISTGRRFCSAQKYPSTSAGAEGLAKISTREIGSHPARVILASWAKTGLRVRYTIISIISSGETGRAPLAALRMTAAGTWLLLMRSRNLAYFQNVLAQYAGLNCYVYTRDITFKAKANAGLHRVLPADRPEYKDRDLHPKPGPRRRLQL